MLRTPVCSLGTVNTYYQNRLEIFFFLIRSNPIGFRFQRRNLCRLCFPRNIMMSNGHEDQLLADLTWSDDSYDLAEFVTEFPLPQVVKVVRGHDGGLDGATLGYGEVLTIHALRESRVLFAYDKDRNPISIANNHPEEFQILPQTEDCALKSCGVEDIPSFYQAVKYLEVIEAHYGMQDDVDSVDFGELLQILDISKANKADKMRVNVRNLETGRAYVLTSKCSARFRPLLDWKRYKAPELKTHQFGLPVRVRFKEVDDGEATVEYQRYEGYLIVTFDIFPELWSPILLLPC